MARKKTTTTVEETELNTPEPEAAPELAPGQLSIAERLSQIIDPDDMDGVFCRIYRQIGNPRQPIREYIVRVDGYLVDEEYLAENYGGGCYFVRYVYKENGVLKNTSGTFNISESYRGKNGAGGVLGSSVQNTLASFMQGLTIDKAIAAFREFRETIAPPKPSVDMTELLKAVLASKQQPLSDAIVIEALKGAQRPQQQPQNLLEQVRQLQEVKQLIKEEPTTVQDDDEEENNGGKMNGIIPMAIEMLSTFLKTNNQNYEAAGAHFKNNSIVNNLLAKDPSLREQFIAAARVEYGDEKTQELARGFGLNVHFIEPEQPGDQPAIEQGATNG